MTHPISSVSLQHQRTDATGDADVLELRDLCVYFGSGQHERQVVDGLSLRIPRGRTAALVGESGCGKSVTAMSILRLLPHGSSRVTGEIILYPNTPAGIRAHTHPESIDLLTLSQKPLRAVRGGRIGMVFQEPMISLNPVFTVGEQIMEVLELHMGLGFRAARKRAIELLDRVEITSPAKRIDNYPHQLSGGMCQRVMIAMAIAAEPELLIADEPTTALDVTVQWKILDLLQRLQREFHMSLLLITHDLGVVSEIADTIDVMYAGRIVEHGQAKDVLQNPLHPYTQSLYRCTDSMARGHARLEVIAGNVPDPSNYPSGCRFHPRCRLSAERAKLGGRSSLNLETEMSDAVLRRCVEQYPEETSGQPPLREARNGHHVACWEANVE